MATFYKHSGEAPVAGLINAFICGTVSASILAVIYAYAVAFIPLTYWVDRVTYRAYQRRVAKQSGTK